MVSQAAKSCLTLNNMQGRMTIYSSQLQHSSAITIIYLAIPDQCLGNWVQTWRPIIWVSLQHDPYMLPR
jgi:hypothetical protein